jgi:hypothetical protein
MKRHKKIIKETVAKGRIEAAIETAELLNQPEFVKALKDYEAGRMKLYDAAKLDRAMSARRRKAL